MDILTTYWPKPEEVSSERVLAIRADLASRIRQVWPLTDTAPNSLFGDTHLSPAAFQIASTEIAWERMQSDLDPENAANGTVWNCFGVETEFVTRTGETIPVTLSCSATRRTFSKSR